MQGFETLRLRILPLTASDEDLYCSLYTDAETMRFICAPLSRARALRSFAKVVERPRPTRGPYLFAIVDKTTLGAFGICAAVDVETQRMRAEVGVMLQSGARGKGYAREALAGMVASTFREHPVDTVWVQCSGLNPLVERMVSSIGFVLNDEHAAGAGPLAQRVWSVQRMSWFPINQKGEGNVERHQSS